MHYHAKRFAIHKSPTLFSHTYIGLSTIYRIKFLKIITSLQVFRKISPLGKRSKAFLTSPPSIFPISFSLLRKNLYGMVFIEYKVINARSWVISQLSCISIRLSKQTRYSIRTNPASDGSPTVHQSKYKDVLKNSQIFLFKYHQF